MAPRCDFFLGAAAVVVVAVLSAGAWEGASAAATGMLCRLVGRWHAIRGGHSSLCLSGPRALEKPMTKLCW